MILQVLNNFLQTLVLRSSKLKKMQDLKISLPGMLFGVYDGHGGASCGIVTANRLQHYVTAGLLPTEDLRNHLDQLKLAGTYAKFIYKLKKICIAP